MKFKFALAIFFLMTVAISPLHAQVIQPQSGGVVQPVPTNPVQGMTSPPIQGVVASPILPHNGGAIATQQPSVIAAQPQQGLGTVNTLELGQTIFVPAGSVIVESLPGSAPGSFITAPITPMAAPLPVTNLSGPPSNPGK